MAQQLICDVCEAEPAVMMQSSLLNGETIAIGQACLPLISLATARQVLEQCEPPVLTALAPELTPLVTAISDWLAEGKTSSPPPAASSDQLDGATKDQEGKETSNAQEPKARPARRRGTT